MIEQFYLGCLAHASYLVADEGAAAVIDPQRDVELYLDYAAQHNLKIEHVILTHLHADFVSGHRELAERTGAKIYLGEHSGARFPHTSVKTGDEIPLGRAALRFLQTPGHTIESISIVLADPNPRAVFTGDTLFVGDVGRPDLAPDHTPQQLAAMLYHSLQEKLLTLPDEIEVFPAHGSGSLCGKQLGEERSTTIGKQRRENYALQARSEDEFIHLLTDSLPTRPEYFEKEVELNRAGASSLDALPRLKPLPPAEVLRLQTEGAIVVDTRPAMQVAVAHVPGSIHIALSGQFASWAARLLGLDVRIILSGEDEDHVRESQLRLARVGLENVEGYLADGIPGWIRSGHRVEYIPQITVTEFEELRAQDSARIALLDVREPGETAAAAIDGSARIPLSQIPARASELDRGKLLVVHCKGGYRSAVATSLLRRAGFEDIANLTGGYDAWKAAQ